MKSFGDKQAPVQNEFEWKRCSVHYSEINYLTGFIKNIGINHAYRKQVFLAPHTSYISEFDLTAVLLHHLFRMTRGGGAVLPLIPGIVSLSFPRWKPFQGKGFFNHYCSEKVTAMMPEGDLYKCTKTSLENKFLWFLTSAISWKATQDSHRFLGLSWAGRLSLSTLPTKQAWGLQAAESDTSICLKRKCRELIPHPKHTTHALFCPLHFLNARLGETVPQLAQSL